MEPFSLVVVIALMFLLIIIAIVIAVMARAHRHKKEEDEEGFAVNDVGKVLKCSNMNRQVMQSAPACGMNLPRLTAGEICVDGSCFNGRDIDRFKSMKDDIVRNLHSEFDDVRERLRRMSNAKKSAFDDLDDRLNQMASDRADAFDAMGTKLQTIKEKAGSRSDGGLIDDFTAASAAYSVKRLYTSYDGPVVQVTNTDTGDDADIAVDKNGNVKGRDLSEWLDGARALVKTWYDQSGNGLDATPHRNGQYLVSVNNTLVGIKFERSFIRQRDIYHRNGDLFSSSTGSYGGDITIEATFYPLSSEGTQYITTDGNNNEARIIFRDGELSAEFAPWGRSRISHRRKTPLKRWYHVVVTHAGDDNSSGDKDWNMYINGEHVESMTNTFRTGHRHYGPDNYLRIGHDFKGIIGTFTMYDAPLSSTEIRNRYARVYSGAMGPSTLVSGDSGLLNMFRLRPVGCYSVKRLFTAFYEGPVIRVRNMGNNETADVYTDSEGRITRSTNSGGSLNNWLDGSRARIDRIYDQSGNGRTVTRHRGNQYLMITDDDVIYGVQFGGSGNLRQNDIFSPNSSNATLSDTSWSNGSYKGDATFEVLFKPRSFSKSNATVVNDHNLNEGYIRVNSNGFRAFWGGSGATTGRLRANMNVSNSKWYHAVITHDNSTDRNGTTVYTFRLYINGELKDEGTSRGDLQNTHYGPDHYLRIGHNYEGLISSIVFYDRVLSPSEISERYRVHKYA